MVKLTFGERLDSFGLLFSLDGVVQLLRGCSTSGEKESQIQRVRNYLESVLAGMREVTSGVSEAKSSKEHIKSLGNFARIGDAYPKFRELTDEKLVVKLDTYLATLRVLEVGGVIPEDVKTEFCEFLSSVHDYEFGKHPSMTS